MNYPRLEWALNPKTFMLMKEERVHRETEKQGQVKMKVRGDESYAARIQEVPQATSSCRGEERFSPKASREHGPTNPLISNI